MLKMLLTERMFPLPVTLAVAFFIAFTGMGVPNYAKTARNKLSSRNVAEVQVKKAEDGSPEAGKIAEIRVRTSFFAPATFHISSFTHEPRQYVSAASTRISARAPPLFNS